MNTRFPYRIPCLFTTVIMVVVLVSTPGHIAAQDTETLSPDLRKWSINLYGGTFLARTDMNITPFTGSAGSRTRYLNPSFGADLEYMAAPALGLSLRYDYSMIENDEDFDSFELTMQSVTAGVNFYPMNVMRSGESRPWFNPYISAHIGQTMSDWSGIDGVEDDDAQHGNYGFGLGAKIRLGSRLDWILDYQYRYFNPGHEIDGGAGTGGSFESDRLAGLTTGFSIKFGSSDRNHSRWYSHAQGTTQWQQSMEARMNEQEASQQDVVHQMDQQTAIIEDIVTDLEGKADQSQLEHLVHSFNELENDLDELSSTLDHELNRMDDIHNAAGLAYLTTEMPEGYYVQVYAAWNTRLVQRALLQTRDTLAEEGINVNELQFYVYQVPSGLFTAQIGRFDDEPAANGVLEAALNLFDDSFVRTPQ